jgi:hypothetical protein
MFFYKPIFVYKKFIKVFIHINLKNFIYIKFINKFEIDPLNNLNKIKFNKINKKNK